MRTPEYVSVKVAIPTRAPVPSRIVAAADVPGVAAAAVGRAGAVGDGLGGVYTVDFEHVIAISAVVATISERPSPRDRVVTVESSCAG